jgi:hypothetical protein
MAAGHGACHAGLSLATLRAESCSPCLPLPSCVFGLVNHGPESQLHPLRRGPWPPAMVRAMRAPPRPRKGRERTRLALLYLSVLAIWKIGHRSVLTPNSGDLARTGNGAPPPPPCFGRRRRSIPPPSLILAINRKINDQKRPITLRCLFC